MRFKFAINLLPILGFGFSLSLGLVRLVTSEKCDEPVYTGPESSDCEGCPVARTSEEVAAINVEYDSRLFLNERKRYLCTEDYPNYRDKCYHHWVMERYAIEYERAGLFAPGSPEREAADVRAKIILKEVMQWAHEL